MKKLGPIDKLPPLLRHLILMIVPIVAGWLLSDVVPALHNQGGTAAIIGVIVSQLALLLTPITRQYGTGGLTSDWAKSDRGAASPAALLRTLGVFAAALLLIAVYTVTGADAHEHDQPAQTIAAPAALVPAVIGQSCTPTPSTVGMDPPGRHLVCSSRWALDLTANAAYVCEGALWWRFQPDDGHVIGQALEVSGRVGPYGQWMELPAAHGGEGALRWAGYEHATHEGTHLAWARVVREDDPNAISNAVRIIQGCPE